MLVNFKIAAKKGVKNNDLIIAKEDGSFELINKDEFLKELVEIISKQQEEIESLKTKVHKCQTNVNSLVKDKIEKK